MNSLNDAITALKATAWAMRQEADDAVERGDRDSAIHCRGVAEGLDIAWRGLQTSRIERRHLMVVK